MAAISADETHSAVLQTAARETLFLSEGKNKFLSHGIRNQGTHSIMKVSIIFFFCWIERTHQRWESLFLQKPCGGYWAQFFIPYIHWINQGAIDSYADKSMRAEPAVLTIMFTPPWYFESTLENSESLLLQPGPHAHIHAVLRQQSRPLSWTKMKVETWIRLHCQTASVSATISKRYLPHLSAITTFFLWNTLPKL